MNSQDFVSPCSSPQSAGLCTGGCHTADPAETPTPGARFQGGRHAAAALADTAPPLTLGRLKTTAGKPHLPTHLRKSGPLAPHKRTQQQRRRLGCRRPSLRSTALGVRAWRVSAPAPREDARKHSRACQPPAPSYQRRPSTGKQCVCPPPPRTGCGRASPPRWRQEGHAAAGARPGGQAEERSAAPSPFPRRSRPRGSEGRAGGTQQDGGDSEGLILRRKAAAAVPAAPRRRYITPCVFVNRLQIN